MLLLYVLFGAGCSSGFVLCCATQGCFFPVMQKSSLDSQFSYQLCKMTRRRGMSYAIVLSHGALCHALLLCLA